MLCKRSPALTRHKCREVARIDVGFLELPGSYIMFYLFHAQCCSEVGVIFGLL